jgi:hypothetical protein
MFNWIEIKVPDSSGDASLVTAGELLRPSSGLRRGAEPAGKGWIGVTWEKYFTGMRCSSAIIEIL